MRCDKCDLKATRVVLSASMPPYDAHYCRGHAPEGASKYDNSPASYRTCEAVMASPHNESPIAVPEAAAKALALRLRDYLDTDTITIRRKSKHEDYWHILVPFKLHDRAQAYLDGWAQGEADALAVRNGRTPHKMLVRMGA